MEVQWRISSAEIVINYVTNRQEKDVLCGSIMDAVFNALNKTEQHDD